MPSHQGFIIQSLDPGKHDRAGFDCGVAALNDYLTKYVRKQVSAHVAACFVACPDNEPTRVAGYYTLSACTITRTELPQNALKGLPPYRDIPATLLGRLARSVDFKGCGLGDLLMTSAFHRALAATQDVASWAIVTDPKDDTADKFYSAFGFRELNADRFFLPMKTIERLLSAR